MKPRPLLQVSISTKPEAEEAISELMGRVFAAQASVYASEETKESVVSVFCEPHDWNANRQAALREGLRAVLASGLNARKATISTRRVAREDWAESWKRHFKPIEVGRQLLVKPSWVKRRPRKNQAVVVLDPGLSFGTGNHPTTLFCLQEVAGCRRAGERQSFWDLGTGSGILAIAAVKLGYRPVEAVDFDPQAVGVAIENARRNRVAQAVRIKRGDVTRLPLRPARLYDVICANLISNLLIEERKRIAARLRPGGTLVLAGILVAEFGEVQRAFEQCGLRLVRSRTEGEWRSGAFEWRR